MAIITTTAVHLVCVRVCQADALIDDDEAKEEEGGGKQGQKTWGSQRILQGL
ncbi:hypothetical protein PTSG_02070 [Salpingoeca rosetta]|uniref:Uncharacterized protein n=1 Tax=Salpingoeca rosetta (strain ATCC 50818 / BSB-021) TaxID=946362 RepID=F2U2J7_SALR5|nr:uncharacterized protein PTSG_02070 [Salpingoeca rosetta]EGD81352.1 hypothetical protein PTSG_02070 [Salpingoeca rosetta]|eukprot:XP_004996556.1 hypothetical protein PTSG_02070 [Salpingoeca rosetta]